MARAFTINFDYQHKSFAAVITLAGGQMSIYVPDSSLHTILPSGKCLVDPKQGVRIDTPRLTPEQDLLLCIMSAIDLNSNDEPTSKRNLFGTVGK